MDGHTDLVAVLSEVSACAQTARSCSSVSPGHMAVSLSVLNFIFEKSLKILIVVSFIQAYTAV